MTPEQRERRNAANRDYLKRRWRDDPEFRERKRLAEDRRRLLETPEQREVRLAKRRAYYRRSLEAETPEQKEQRLAERRRKRKR